nr:MAG TPA: hypothetical protein [Caudoviricetes sp.]
MIFSLCSKYKFLVSPALRNNAITDAPNPSVFKYSRYLYSCVFRIHSHYRT